MAKHHAEMARLYRALGNPARLQILTLLRDREMARGELARKMGIPAPNFAQHLARLRGAKLIKMRRKEKETYYRISDPKILVLGDTAREIYKRSYEK